MTKPIRMEHFADCIAWWGGADRQGREEGPQAWKVTTDEVKARGYNLDFKNPHSEEADLGDPVLLLKAVADAELKTANLRDQLKAILSEALVR